MMRGVMVARSAEILLDTLARSARLPDTYFWGKAYVLDALCRLGVPQGMAPARHCVEQLMDTAVRAGMRELMVRAHLHLEGLGDRGGAGTARVLALEIDNPMLTALTARSAIRPRKGMAFDELADTVGRDPFAGTPRHKHVPIRIERLRAEQEAVA